ncbi:MAG TPA: M67 family metallopeptidase [Acidimicrobiia bacterium]|nr:M67 family metallopeptidase [Acidimicrobiia bacterium]
MTHAFAHPTLRLTPAQYLAIVGNCYDGLPDEACGLLLGPMVDGEATGRVAEARPCRNADASARTYTVDPKDMLAAMRAAEAMGVEIVGVWHSHTHTDAYPSPTDVRQAVDPAWLYVIVSLRDQAPVLRAYRIRDERIAEVAVALDR